MNKIEVIGLDMDGVTQDLQSFQLNRGKKYFSKMMKVSEDELFVDDKKYDIEEIFNVSRSERMKFWAKNIWFYSLFFPPREGVKEKTNKWHKEKRKVVIITGRVYTSEKSFLGFVFRLMVKLYLKINGIYYDKIAFCDEKNSASEKARICKELNVDLMIEDKIDNIDEISKNSKVVCFNNNWNLEYNNEKVDRISEFEVVDSIIEKIEKNDFKRLSSKKLKSLSSNEKIEYYKKLREYIKSLPLDEEKIAIDEKKYKIFSNIIIPIFNAMYSPKIENKNLIEKKDSDVGTIFVSNHLGSLDQFPVIGAIGKNRPLHIMASTTLLKLKRGVLYRNVGCMFIDLNDIKSMYATMEEASKLLLNNHDIFIFPEATRNTSDKFMLDFKTGAVMLAQETGAKIQPFSVNDDYKLFKNNLTANTNSPIEVSVTDDLNEANDNLRNTIATLLWDTMEKEKESGVSFDREELIKVYQKKKQKIEAQREKIK